MGPVVAAAGVQWFGLGGIWRLAALGWLVSGVLYVRLRHVPAPVRSAEAGAFRVAWPRMRKVFPPLIWIMVTRILMLVALTTYLPLYITNVKEGDLWLGALSLTLLEGAGVVGALAVVQDQFPDHRALANGTFIGLNFLIRAAGIGVIGWLADAFGLTTAFLWGAGLAFLTLPAVWRLPGRTS